MKPEGSVILSLRRWNILIPLAVINGAHGAIRLPLSLLLFHGGLSLATAQNATAAASNTTEDSRSFDPTMAILMIVLVSVFFFLGFFSVYIRQCLERAMGDNVQSFDPGNWLSLRPALRGLDASVIETFPTFLYSTVKTLRIGKQALECPVCLNEFEDNETLRLIPKCCHVFHPGCIDAWLQSHATCPLCRTNLVPRPGESVSLPIADPARETNHSSTRAPSDYGIRGVLDSPDARLVNSVTWSNKSMPRRSMSAGHRLAGLLSQFNSPGQPVEGSLERFTLRLPEEVHDQLVNRTSYGEKSDVAFPEARSPTSGYRTGNLGSERNYFYYERFEQDGRLDRRPFSITPPHRTGLLRSPDGGVDNDAVSGDAPKGLFQAIRSPLDRLFLGKNNIGERSSDHLRADFANHV